MHTLPCVVSSVFGRGCDENHLWNSSFQQRRLRFDAGHEFSEPRVCSVRVHLRSALIALFIHDIRNLVLPKKGRQVELVSPFSGQQENLTE